MPWSRRNWNRSGIKADGLIIKKSQLFGAKVNGHHDHRIVMACAVAGLGAKGETKIQNSECVEKSYPMFFEDLRSLGAKVIGGQFDRQRIRGNLLR